MKLESLEHLLSCIERTGRGWVYGGDIPPCGVLLDGVPVKNVMAINRKRGMLRMYYTPLKVDKHKKRVLFFTLAGW